METSSKEGVEVCVVHQGEPIHIVTESYDGLVEQLVKLHFDPDSLSLSYIDEDNDRISVKCSLDFIQLVRETREKGQKVAVLSVDGTRILPQKTPTPAVDIVEEKTDEKKKAFVAYTCQTLDLIEGLQKKLEENLREIQNISAVLESSSSKEPQEPQDSVQEMEQQQKVVVPVVEEAKVVCNSDRDENIVDSCNGASKKVIDQCVELVSTLPSYTNQVSSTVSHLCQTIFDESCAKTNQQSARQVELSQAETRDVVNLVRDTTDKLLERQERDRVLDDAGLKRAKELAEEVQHICANLSKETADSCQAITRCVSEMVQNI